MHVDREGREDGPDLVLLHGGIGAGRYHWSRQLPALSAQFRVHLPDLPGHGRTPLPEDGRYDGELLVTAVEGLLDALPAPVHVGGFSMGAHAALALAARRPELFASLVLIGVSYREHEGLRRWRSVFTPEGLEKRYPLWARALARLHDPLGGLDAWRDVARRDSAGVQLHIDLDALGRVGCPLLLVRGDRDWAVDPRQYAEMREVVPHAEELVVPGGGHDVQLTRAPVVRCALIDFYERLDVIRPSRSVTRGAAGDVPD